MKKTFQKRNIRFLIRCLIIFFLILTIVLGLAYFILLKNPEDLLSGPLRKLEQETGWQIKIGSISVNLLPLPAISVSDFAIKNDDLDFSAAWASIRPDFLLLFTGNFTPAQISLLRPRLTMNSRLNLAEPQLMARQFKPMLQSGNNKANSDMLELLEHGLTLNLQQAHVHVAGLNGTLLSVANLDCQIEASSRAFEGRMRLPALALRQTDQALVGLEDVYIQGKISLKDFFDPGNYIRCNGQFAYHEQIRNCQFKLDFKNSEYGSQLNFSSSGAIILNNSPQPFAVNGAAIRYSQQKEISISHCEWQFGNDHGILNVAFNPPDNGQSFKLEGIFTAERLSLTQWFGFARNLAPGLQLSLDNVLDAKLAFQLDDKSLRVPKIDATCSGARFSGSGGVPSFSSPVVMLNLKTEKANLGLALGESLGRSPLEPWFEHPPLTPMPGEPLKQGETGVGYDIRLAARSLIYGPLKIANSSLRIYPGKIDKDGLEEVLLDASADFYGGKFKGNCILGAPASLPIAITASCNNISAQALYQDLPAVALNKGKIKLGVNVSSEGKELKPFLANLKGQVSVSGSEAALAQNKNLRFSSLTALIRLRNAAMTGNKLWFDGNWQLAAAMDLLSLETSLEGKIWFGQNGVELKSLPANFKINLRRDNGILPTEMQITGKGNTSFQSSTKKFALSQAAFNLAGMNLNGNLNFDGSKNNYDGNYSFNQPNLQNFLTKLGLSSINLPKALNSLKMASNFSGSSDQIRFSKLSSTLGQTKITGDLTWLNTGNSIIKFNLDADKINLETLSFSSAPKNEKPRTLDFPFMRIIETDGLLKVKNISGWKMQCLNARIPIKLKAGQLTASPISANLYGAVLDGSLNADFKKGISFTNRMSAKAIDLKSATSPFLDSGVLSGLATIEIYDNAQLLTTDQFPAALNGRWNLQISNGAWQGKNNKGQLKGKPTILGRVTASGTIDKGVLNTSNIVLQGPELAVKGTGRLNLATKKIDCKLDINMKGVPDFPLTVYGTLDKPKTSIGAGKLVLNALGEIAGGVGDIIGGIAQGIWKIFK